MEKEKKRGRPKGLKFPNGYKSKKEALEEIKKEIPTESEQHEGI